MLFQKEKSIRRLYAFDLVSRLLNFYNPFLTKLHDEPINWHPIRERRLRTEACRQACDLQSIAHAYSESFANVFATMKGKHVVTSA